MKEIKEMNLKELTHKFDKKKVDWNTACEINMHNALLKLKKKVSEINDNNFVYTFSTNDSTVLTIIINDPSICIQSGKIFQTVDGYSNNPITFSNIISILSINEYNNLKKGSNISLTPMNNSNSKHVILKRLY